MYTCNYPGCTKAYGTLNHLNAHAMHQKHGPKRLPSGSSTMRLCPADALAEFKEIRKEWRAKKKQTDQLAHGPQIRETAPRQVPSSPAFDATFSSSSPIASLASDPYGRYLNGAPSYAPPSSAPPPRRRSVAADDPVFAYMPPALTYPTTTMAEPLDSNPAYAWMSGLPDIAPIPPLRPPSGAGLTDYLGSLESVPHHPSTKSSSSSSSFGVRI